MNCPIHIFVRDPKSQNDVWAGTSLVHVLGGENAVFEACVEEVDGLGVAFDGYVDHVLYEYFSVCLPNR